MTNEQQQESVCLVHEGTSLEISINARRLQHIHRDHVGAGIRGRGFPREFSATEPWHELLPTPVLTALRDNPISDDRSPLRAAVLDQVNHSIHRPLYARFAKVSVTTPHRTDSQWEFLCPSGLSVIAKLDRFGPGGKARRVLIQTAFFRNEVHASRSENRWRSLLRSRRRLYCRPHRKTNTQLPAQDLEQVHSKIQTSFGEVMERIVLVTGENWLSESSADWVVPRAKSTDRRGWAPTTLTHSLNIPVPEQKTQDKKGTHTGSQGGTQ